MNLLPPQEKKIQAMEKNRALILVLCNIVIISLLSFVLILLSLRFYILENANYQNSLLDLILKRNQDQESVFLSGVIKKYNSVLVPVNNHYESNIYMSDVLKIMSVIPRPEGLKFSSITAENTGGAVKLIIAGNSDTRDNLLYFKKYLETQPPFVMLSRKDLKIGSIVFPADSWVKSQDIDFNITLRIQSDAKQ